MDSLEEVRRLAAHWREAVAEANDRRAHLNAAILKAKEAGYSFTQLRDATGMGTGTIQMVLAKAGWEEPY